jgi:hypothetical protein
MSNFIFDNDIIVSITQNPELPIEGDNVVFKAQVNMQNLTAEYSNASTYFFSYTWYESRDGGQTYYQIGQDLDTLEISNISKNFFNNTYKVKVALIDLENILLTEAGDNITTQFGEILISSNQAVSMSIQNDISNSKIDEKTILANNDVAAIDIENLDSIVNEASKYDDTIDDNSAAEVLSGQSINALEDTSDSINGQSIILSPSESIPEPTINSEINTQSFILTESEPKYTKKIIKHMAPCAQFRYERCVTNNNGNYTIDNCGCAQSTIGFLETVPKENRKTLGWNYTYIIENGKNNGPDLPEGILVRKEKCEWCCEGGDVMCDAKPNQTNIFPNSPTECCDLNWTRPTNKIKTVVDEGPFISTTTGRGNAGGPTVTFKKGITTVFSTRREGIPIDVEPTPEGLTMIWSQSQDACYQNVSNGIISAKGVSVVSTPGTYYPWVYTTYKTGLELKYRIQEFKPIVKCHDGNNNSLEYYKLDEKHNIQEIKYTPEYDCTCTSTGGALTAGNIGVYLDHSEQGVFWKVFEHYGPPGANCECTLQNPPPKLYPQPLVQIDNGIIATKYSYTMSDKSDFDIKPIEGPYGICFDFADSVTGSCLDGANELSKPSDGNWKKEPSNVKMCGHEETIIYELSTPKQRDIRCDIGGRAFNDFDSPDTLIKVCNLESDKTYSILECSLTEKLRPCNTIINGISTFLKPEDAFAYVQTLVGSPKEGKSIVAYIKRIKIEKNEQTYKELSDSKTLLNGFPHEYWKNSTDYTIEIIKKDDPCNFCIPVYRSVCNDDTYPCNDQTVNICGQSANCAGKEGNINIITCVISLIPDPDENEIENAINKKNGYGLVLDEVIGMAEKEIKESEDQIGIIKADTC